MDDPIVQLGQCLHFSNCSPLPARSNKIYPRSHLICSAIHGPLFCLYDMTE